jgi:hypothetical protein
MEPTAHAQPPETGAEDHVRAEASPDAYDEAEAAHEEPVHDEPVGRRERETFGLVRPDAGRRGEAGRPVNRL